MTAGDSGAAAGRGGPSPRPKLTSRAAVLAVVICAVTLSLAYPVREYLAERRQIDQLESESAQLASRLQSLRAEARALTSPVYIEQQARDQLHMCFPSQNCYVVISPSREPGAVNHGRAATPWYQLLWASVKAADKEPSRR
jgi:cell division protein FtsB